MDADLLGRARSAKTQRVLEPVRSTLSRLAGAIEDLLVRIETTPNTKADQRVLLRELRAEKKELQAEKREIRAELATVRREARRASANAGHGSILGWQTYDGRLAAAERRAIRRQKEARLAPHEDEIDALDRQIADVDCHIEWVRRFGDAADDE